MFENISDIERSMIDFLFNRDCLKIGYLGDFILKSGRESSYFMNMGEGFDTGGLEIIGDAYANHIMKNFPNFDFIFGPAEKGTAIAIAAAVKLPPEYGNIPVFWNRKIPKAYGELKRDSWIVGPYKKLIHLVERDMHGLPYIEVDDVITTGKTKVESKETLEKEIGMISKELGVKPPELNREGIIISLNRRETDEQGRNPARVFEEEFGTPISWVTDSYNAFAHLRKAGKIKSGHLSHFINYQKEHGLEEDKERIEALKQML